MRVFGKTTVWFRLKMWIVDLISHFKALPSYLRPKKLKSRKLTQEEIEEAMMD